MSLTIYHNPQDPTSCEVLACLRSKGMEPVVIEFMKDPPGRTELVRLINRLRVSASDLMREQETRRMGINRTKMEINAALETMALNPQVLAYPIVVSDKGGRVCTSPEMAEMFLSETLGHA